VRDRIGADVETEFATACHGATGGNPLLAQELLRTLASDHIPPVAASIPIVERVAPDAVARSVRLRLSRLPPAASRLARAVAGLGDGADREDAAALARLALREVAPTAALLARADLIGSEPPFAFVHPVVRNAVYESISVDRRQQDHARAADILIARRAPLGHVAAQVLLAPPESVDEAVSTLHAAPREAAGEGAPEIASRYLLRALDEPMTAEQRGELLLELAGVEANVGAPAVIAHLREAESSLRDPERRAEAS